MEEIYEDRHGNRCVVSGLMAWAMNKERECFLECDKQRCDESNVGSADE